MVAEDVRIGVYVCECGQNIAGVVDIDRVIETISVNRGVAIIKRHKLLCSGDGKEFLKKEIIDGELTHVVVAACSPKDHEGTFASVCEQAGINPYMYRIINIREQCAWMIKDREAATDKAISYIRAGISRVLYQSPLVQSELDSVPDVLVIGGGIAGIEAALSLASSKRKVYLVEKADSLGGIAARLSDLPGYQGSVELIKKKINAVLENDNIEVYTGSRVTDAIGFLGNFEIVVRCPDDRTEEFKTGAIIVATGFGQYDPSGDRRWGYGEINNVHTALEVEERLAAGDLALADGTEPKSIAMVHCVGRDEVGYCSGTCCNYMMKIAGRLKKRYPKIEITHIVRELCLPCKEDEAFYKQLSDKGIVFIRGEKVGISEGKNGIEISCSTESGDGKSISTDMVVLATAMIPGEDSEEIAQMLDLPLDENGFFEEEHMLLGPVNTSVDGVFVVGSAQGPRNIADSLVQSRAAAGAILARLIPGKKILPEIKVSEIVESLCTGCQTCVEVCSYGAAAFDLTRGVSVINGAICRGCGNCVGSCPSGAVRSKHFTERQLYQEVIEALGS